MRRLLDHRPSPALVISCIALFVALGGSSAAAIVITSKNIKNGTIRNRDIHRRTISHTRLRKNTLTGREIRESTLGTVPTSTGFSHFAVVTSAGILARGRGVSSATRTGAGRYQVIFTRDVRNCAYVATQGGAGAVVPPSGSISVASLASNVNGVKVHTFSSTPNAVDRSFHLLVNC